METAWLLERRLGPEVEALFLRAASTEMRRVDLVDADWVRAADLIATYADLPFGLVDASVVAGAERLEVDVVATLDRRHFGVVRPRHADAFRLVP